MANSFIERVIALDLRARKVGYVVFEGSDKLLDWGIRVYAKGDRSLLESILGDLRRMFAPSIILIRKTAKHYRLRQPTIRPALRTVKLFAELAFIPTRVIDSSALRRFFSKEMKVNKQDVSRMVADRFPELSWRLPPQRKSWQPEARRQSIFDAASVGLFYFAQP
jgi:hypothetical protein